MTASGSTRRLLLLSAVLLAGVAVIHASAPGDQTPRREPLSQLPTALGGWRAAADIPIDNESLRVLNADDYVNRAYVHGDRVVDLFIAYYATQRQGGTMHSPLNCLPASGWQPMSTGRVRVEGAPGPPVDANRVVIQKGLDRQLVVYWYQSQGRTIASEYASKAYLVLDSLRRHRSDGAIVRLVVPLTAPGLDASHPDLAAAEFVRALRPLIPRYVPD